MKNKITLIIIFIILFITKVDAATTMPELVNGTITLTEDVTLVSAFTVNSGEDITLNLNNYTLTNSSGVIIEVKSGGNLTITGSGIIDKSDDSLIYNYGSVTIEDGTFNGQIVTWDDASLKINSGTYNGPSGNSPTLYNYGDIIIDDGTFTSDSSIVIYNLASSSLIINKGDFTSSSSNVIYGSTDTNIEINNGIFTSNINKPTLYILGTLVINNGTFTNENSNIINSRTNSNITINDGTFNGGNGSYSMMYIYGTLTINNGNFNSDAASIVFGREESVITIISGTFTDSNTSEPAIWTYGNLTISDVSITSDMISVAGTSSASITINSGTITSKSSYALYLRGNSLMSVNGGNINGFIGLVDNSTLNMNGGTFKSEDDYLINQLSSDVVTISGGEYIYSNVLLSSSSTKEVIIDGVVTGPLELNNYAVSGAIITLNASVDSEETLDIIEGVQILVPPTVSFKIKDIIGEGIIDVTDDRYEIVYVDGYYIMRLKEIEVIPNPSTDIKTPYIIGFILIISSVILIILYHKKKYI